MTSLKACRGDGGAQIGERDAEARVGVEAPISTLEVGTSIMAAPGHAADDGACRFSCPPG